MLDLTEYGSFAQLLKVTEQMINDASREDIITTASILAIQAGQYRRKFGFIPMDEAMDLLEAEEPSENQAGWVADGLENLAEVL